MICKNCYAIKNNPYFKEIERKFSKKNNLSPLSESQHYLDATN